jgi:RNA recognition motif-containing protein
VDIQGEENRMRIFVGHLSRDVTDDDLRQAFEPFGKVDSAEVVREKFSSESKGFGFVEMPATAEAQAAIAGANGQMLKGQALNVSEARPRPPRRDGGGGGPRGRRG